MSSDDPKNKPNVHRVPTFEELRGPRASSASEPEEKTTQINPEVLRAALARSKAASQPPTPLSAPDPDEKTRPTMSAWGPTGLRVPPPPPGSQLPQSRPPVPNPPSSNPPSGPRAAAPPPPPAYARVPPPPPGGQRSQPITDPLSGAVPRAHSSTPEPTTDKGMTARGDAMVAGPLPPGQPMPANTVPAMPVIRPQAAAPTFISGRGEQPLNLSLKPETPKPVLTQNLTEAMPPITVDDMPQARASPGRPIAHTLTGVLAAAPAKPLLGRTLISVDHQGEVLPEPSQSPFGPYEDEAEPHAPPTPPTAELRRLTREVTQPGAQGPFVSPRQFEPSSGSEKPAVPAPLGHEPPTRRERPSRDLEPFAQIARDIHSEVKKLPKEVVDHDARTGTVDPLEVIAHPAPLWRRVGALLFDGGILVSLDVAVGRLLFTLVTPPPLPDGLSLLDVLSFRVHDSPKLLAAVAVLAVGLATAYTTLFAVIGKGRTIGRFIFGLRLVDRRGGPLTPPRALVRSAFALVSAGLCMAGFWLALFDRKGQTLHDKLCSTFVVRLGPSRT